MKIKDIKPYEWAIGISVGIIGYFVIRNLSKLGGSEINGIHLSTEDKKSVADINSEKIKKQALKPENTNSHKEIKTLD